MNCISKRGTSGWRKLHWIAWQKSLCYKSIINYDLDITNSLAVSPQIRYIEVFDITNPDLTNKFGRSPATSLNQGSTVQIAD